MAERRFRELLCWIAGGCLSKATDDPNVRVCPNCHRVITLRAAGEGDT